jgi:protease-4
MEALYETFLARVAEGRRLSVKSVSQVAEGRIWSGLQARTAGLVDAIGGPIEALRETCRRAGFRTGERFELEVHPRRPRLGLGALFGATRWALRSAGIGTRSR